MVFESIEPDIQDKLEWNDTEYDKDEEVGEWENGRFVDGVIAENCFL